MMRFTAIDMYVIKGRGTVYAVHVQGVYESGAHLCEAWVGREASIFWNHLHREGVIAGVELQMRGGSFGPSDQAGILLK